MSLHVLAYNLKRVIAILGVEPLSGDQGVTPTLRVTSLKESAKLGAR
jgi:hypothetical protein